MKFPKAKKLKSGNWNIQVQIDGKRYSRTGATKKEVREKIAKLYIGIEAEKKASLTVGMAIDRYISEKKGVLSPSTVRGYLAIRKNYLQSIMNMNLYNLTQSDIQIAVSRDVDHGISSKTIKNSHGLLSAVLKEFRPDFIVNTKLPQKTPSIITIPSEEEMMKIWSTSANTKYELPILLASWLGLRVSEIRGLKFSDISDGHIHIQRAVVPDEDGNSIEKLPKTESGDRWIKLPKIILDKISKLSYTFKNDYICPMSRAAIYEGFVRICKKAGVGHYRFHDLRHFAASEAHSLGVPDKYAMRRMGHATDNMLKYVYQHTMRDKEDEFSSIIDAKMEDLFKNANENANAG